MQHTAVIFPMECQATIPRTEAPPEHRAASDSLAPSTPHSGYGSKIETEIYSTIWQPCSEQADLAPAVHPEENNLVICRGQRGGVCHMGVGLDEVGEGNIQTRSHPRTDRAIVQVSTLPSFTGRQLQTKMNRTPSVSKVFVLVPRDYIPSSSRP